MVLATQEQADGSGNGINFARYLYGNVDDFSGLMFISY